MDENWEIESKEFFDFYSFILGIFSLLLYNKHTTTHNNTHYKIWDGSDKRSHHPRTKMINDVTIIMRKRNETILMKHFIMKKIHKLNVSLSLLHSTSVDDYNSQDSRFFLSVLCLPTTVVHSHLKVLVKRPNRDE